jgi:glycosyltransferase involved in cell wall biosynthesis
MLLAERAPTVSVVVPTYQRRESLTRLLEALGAQSHPLDDFEVIVVDDGSADGTGDYLAAVRPEYEFRHFWQRNSGPGAARNLGVVHARGALVVFFDDDVVPDANAIAAHVAAHRAAPDTVVIGPMLPPRVWPRPSWIRWEEEQLLQQYNAMIAGVYACTPRQLFTANASLERRSFLQAGGFDPTFARAEDVELGYRLRDRGSRFAFEPRAAVVHYPQRTFASWRRTPYQYGRGDVAMHRDKGHQALELAFWEFHRRHPLNRALARLCVGRPLAFAATTLSLRAMVRVTDALSARRVARAALSALFNVLYWQGVADALGSRDDVWRSVASQAGSAA